ncbi:MAG: HD domain-containing protein [Paludibacteraceae bacterium]|nr:HD domain-containing protein [Paludibacteraceae bacterium]
MNTECYVIGGYVRDMLLHRPSKDIDIVTVGSGIDLARAVAKRIGKGAHLSVFKTYGTAQVKSGGMELEFVGARRESYRSESRNPQVEQGTLEDDQLRRDFTINALALCLNGERFGELTDPFDGVSDLHNLIIRTPADPDVTFSDDPLRMMRGIRFASQLGFYLESETFDAMARNADRIKIITQERIDDELCKIIMSPRPSVGFNLLDRTGLLQRIMPEVAALKGVQTMDGHGHKDNLEHTMQVLDTVAKQSANLWLRWAALLHDIGKARTKRYDAKLGWTFHSHDFVGSKMVPELFRRMKLPLDERMRYVQKLVALHMRAIGLSDDGVTDSAVRRLLFDAGDDVDDLMLLCDADITSKNPEKVRRYRHNYEIVRQKMRQIEEKDRIRNFQPPIGGQEIMKVFNLPPSDMVGQIKAAIKDAILDGLIPNEHEAAYQYMLSRAAEYGLTPDSTPVSQTQEKSSDRQQQMNQTDQQ